MLRLRRTLNSFCTRLSASHPNFPRRGELLRGSLIEAAVMSPRRQTLPAIDGTVSSTDGTELRSRLCGYRTR
jgi:hypothetical protein